MFARVSAFLLCFFFFAICTSADASVVIPRADQCNTGVILCCNSVQPATSPAVSQLAGLLGVDLGSTTGLVGLTCSSITVIGSGGNLCNGQPVCCTGSNIGGVLVLGCTPINLNL
ncbi:putative hydrophobin [Lyophyllum shimeji]|uniref:Hydrophobin n=1 Tax=Lyophyllum shimeji TaxID=47721 RepID=A0A9P3PUK5_LYOSH|nr:putative hydrophobin [Lyophyllum shimeji]